MFIHPRPFWKHIYEPFIRQSAGLGQAPRDRDQDKYEHFYAFTDVLVIGGGVAGLQAARAAGQAGAKVLLIEQTAHWGGRAPVDGDGALEAPGGRVHPRVDPVGEGRRLLGQRRGPGRGLRRRPGRVEAGEEDGQRQHPGGAAAGANDEIRR